jgi:hypothetical protein
MQNIAKMNGSDCPKCHSQNSMSNFVSGKRSICRVCGYRQVKRGRQHKFDSLINEYTQEIEVSFWAKRMNRKFRDDFSLLARLQFDLRTDRFGRAIFFPFTRRSGNITEIRKIFFDNDGYISKSIYPRFIFKSPFISLFNEYQIFHPSFQVDKEKPLILLESEIRCVEFSIAAPEYTWLSPGVGNPLTLENANVIKDSGKNVIIAFEDNPASHEREQEAFEILTELGVNAYIMRDDSKYYNYNRQFDFADLANFLHAIMIVNLTIFRNEPQKNYEYRTNYQNV